MKKIILLFTLLFITSLSFSQKKDKIKGSKIVTTEIKKIESFSSLEVADNFEILLIKGTENALEIEADDNLHETIDFTMNGSTLRISSTKNIISAKKLSVKVTYTSELKSITVRDDASITALTDLELDSITFNSYDNSKLFLNVKSKNFVLNSDDKSKSEINVKSETVAISLLKSANIKALISCTNLTFDLYQKSQATIEGDAETMKLRMDNNADFIGKNLITSTMDLTTESYTKAVVNVKKNISIQASGKSEIQLFGEQKIDLVKFTESAVLIKKPMK